MLTIILAVALIWSASMGTARAADARDAFDATMNKALIPYLRITTALAADKTDGVVDNAKTIAALAATLDASGIAGEHAVHYQSIAAKLGPAAAKLAQAANIEAMRNALKDLSQPMAMWQHHAQPQNVNVAYCSMTKASWLQEGADIRNPYYGAAMLTCGEIVDGPGKGTAGGTAQHH